MNDTNLPSIQKVEYLTLTEDFQQSEPNKLELKGK